ncbi:MAG: hypothetical protein KDA51_16685, partial [Planctomycetales bacterium]|nr:hypothetical protein [Planctomycetales bacterium]
LTALVKQAEVDEIGLCPAAMHAIWTLAGLADSGSVAASDALAAACELGFKHVSSPVRNAAVGVCNQDQLAAAIDLGLQTDVDPKVRLTLLLRIADSDAASVIDGNGLVKLLPSIQTDDVLLDAWTSAASTDPAVAIVAMTKSEQSSTATNAKAASVLAEHLARSRPSAEQISQLLQIDPNAKLAVTVWESLAKGWPRDLTILLPASSQKLVRERFLSDQASVESKAAILSVADKWSVENLADIVGEIQGELLTTALNEGAATDERLSAWDQSIRLAPTSPKILDALEEFFTPQLSPATGVEALRSLQNARVDGLSESLLGLRTSLGPKLGSEVLTLLLSRSETTESLLDAIT